MERKLLRQRVIEFSKDIIDLCNALDQLRQYIISKQLLKSATAIGAMAFEAQQAETTDDFIHKLKVACKEANETEYWLCLCEKFIEVEADLKNDLTIIKKFINKSIATAKETKKKKEKEKGDRRT